MLFLSETWGYRCRISDTITSTNISDRVNLSQAGEVKAGKSVHVNHRNLTLKYVSLWKIWPRFYQNSIYNKLNVLNSLKTRDRHQMILNYGYEGQHLILNSAIRRQHYQNKCS